jgi:hypothetical protein
MHPTDGPELVEFGLPEDFADQVRRNYLAKGQQAWVEPVYGTWDVWSISEDGGRTLFGEYSSLPKAIANRVVETYSAMGYRLVAKDSAAN